MYLVKELRPSFVDSDDALLVSLVSSPDEALNLPWLKDKGADKVDGVGKYRYVHARGFIVAVISPHGSQQEKQT